MVVMEQKERLELQAEQALQVLQAQVVLLVQQEIKVQLAQLVAQVLQAEPVSYTHLRAHET